MANPYRILPLNVLSVVLTFTVFTQLQAQTVANNYVRNYLQRVASESGAPGVSAAVSVKGKTVFSGGVGYADLDNRVLQNGETVHYISSVSKAVSVIAIMQLEEKGYSV